MLTKRQKQILDYIKTYIAKKDYSPTLEEIKKHFNLSSLSTIHEHIQRLEKKGYLKKEDNQPRSIEIKEQDKGRDKEKEKNKGKQDKGKKKKESSGLASIPLLGYISAGSPIKAVEDSKKIKLAKNQLSSSGKHFALKVKGESMIEEGIMDEDIVVVRKQETAEDGETIVALIEGENVTLKKIYREKDKFRLEPANYKMEPIYAKNLKIQGKVVSVIRKVGKKKKKKDKKEREGEKEKKKEKEFKKETLQYIKKTPARHRKKLGQFFTPKTIREKLLSKLPKNIKSPKVLDPACGTGEFLTTAEKYFKNPQLYGFEIEEKLAKISRKTSPKADIKRTDTLEKEEERKYDFVIGNPPYFEFSPKEEIKNKFKEVISGRVNIFSLFIKKSIDLLKEDGYLAFVVPPSMNNGSYFQKLREYIVKNGSIEYLKILDDSKLFKDAQQSTMLLVLRKAKQSKDYTFKRNGILIFTEHPEFLKKAFENKTFLKDLGCKVRTGKLTWNENKELLTNDKKKGIPLIWSRNITKEGLDFPKKDKKKPQYVKTDNYDTGPAVVVNRITGRVKSGRLRSAVIPKGMKFIAENHVNVIYPLQSQKQAKLDFDKEQKNKEKQKEKKKKRKRAGIEEIARQLSSPKNFKVIQKITGNTQLSKTELEKLFPISV